MSYFAISARSAVGLVRSGNEDSALASSRIVAVADGMGGHAAGEVASKIAVTTLSELIPVIINPEIDAESADDIYLNSFQEIDGAIKLAVDENPQLTGMGTTLSSLFLRGEKVALLHVGDSRVYRLRGNSLEQLSVDHTVIQELLSQGAISESDISNHPQRSVLTQVLMGEGNLELPLPVFDTKLKDRYLLCSDGLSTVLSDKEIKSLLKEKDRDHAVNALIDATYINGAPDNVTVVIADLVEDVQPSDIQKFGAAS
ncbi:MAG: hypothetical protein RL381_780 [Actinomycetota bacterium]|jgi:serine/threonine protein phosphatase PrpC